MILTEQQIETIRVAYKEWLKAVESSLPKEMKRRAQVSKEMKDLLEEVKLFHGGSFNSEQLCRSIKIQRKVHNLNPIALPKFLGYFQYSRYFKGFKGSTEEFKEQHPKLQGPGESGLGYPGVDLKDFSESLRQLLISEGDDFASSAEKVISFQGVGPAVLSGYLYLFDPDRFPLVNSASIGGIEKIVTITSSQKRKAVKPGKEFLKITKGTIPTVSSYISRFYILYEIKQKLGFKNFHEVDYFCWEMHKGLNESHEPRYWQIAPGENAKLWDDLLINSIAAVGFSELDIDLAGQSKEKLFELYEKSYPQHDEGKMKIKAGQLWNFVNLKPGDKFVTNKGKKYLLALGVVKGGYKFRPERKEYKHTIDVEYYKVSDDGIAIPKSLQGKFGKTIISLKKSDFETLEALFNSDVRPSWIFQANQDYFDLAGALKVLKERRWGVHKFQDEIRVGDTAYLWQSGSNAGIMAVGEVSNEPEKMSIADDERPFIKQPDKFKKLDMRVRIRIDQVLDKPILKQDLKNDPILSNLHILKFAPGAIFRLTTEQARSLAKLIPPPEVVWVSIKDKLLVSNMGDDFELDRLYFQNEVQLKTRIKSSLENGKHIILIGPPGTGKSKLAKVICEFYRGKEQYVMSTATSDWSTFETIGGYRPDNQENLVFFPGIFLQCFQRQDGHPVNNWLIIDEINRADIDKAFGSLFSALTGDDITLPFEISGHQIKIIGKPIDTTEIRESQFIIPPDWRIIATMNTFDKTSLYEMSYAFMRRFAFIPIDIPTDINATLLKRYLEMWNLKFNEDLCKNIAEIWKAVNDKRKIGPAIIEDMYKYTIANKTDYVSAIIMYVLPQFEGVVEENQIEFIKQITSLPYISNSQELKYFSSEFFGLDVRKFD